MRLVSGRVPYGNRKAAELTSFGYHTTVWSSSDSLEVSLKKAKGNLRYHSDVRYI